MNVAQENREPDNSPLKHQRPVFLENTLPTGYAQANKAFAPWFACERK